uniref:Uncharacterized protein n=1 Tax=Arundo donax TaxID=35708 RepID=A0A0A9GT06_ARUDO
MTEQASHCDPLTAFLSLAHLHHKQLNSRLAHNLQASILPLAPTVPSLFHVSLDEYYHQQRTDAPNHLGLQTS